MSTGGRLKRYALGLMRLAADQRYRSVKLRAWFGGKDQFQPFNQTAENRYPEIFAYLRLTLGDHAGLRLLSFGCSTGEEVFSLARYFPTAAIRGIDINPVNIAAANARLAQSPDPRLSFAVAGTPQAEAAGSFDAVLCLAVLRDGRLGKRPATCTRYLRFAAFEAAVSGLDRVLKAGGLLAIQHSNFRLADTTLASGYEVALSLPEQAGRTPIYGPADRLLDGETYPDCVFRKLSTPGSGHRSA